MSATVHISALKQLGQAGATYYECVGPEEQRIRGWLVAYFAYIRTRLTVSSHHYNNPL